MTVAAPPAPAAQSRASADAKKSLAFGHFRKTKLCTFFLSNGSCKFGKSCNFAHSSEDLQTQVSLAKTSLCKAFLKGICPLAADDCCFAHGKKELRRVLPEEQQQTAGKKGGKKETAKDAFGLQKGRSPTEAKEKAIFEVSPPPVASDASTCSSLPLLDEDCECSSLATDDDKGSESTWSSTTAEAPSRDGWEAKSASRQRESSPSSGSEAAFPVQGNVLVPAFVWQGKVFLGNLEEVLQQAQPEYYED